MIVFLDTNVIFSAMLSDRGAAFEVFRLAQDGIILLKTSDHCLHELHRAAEKVDLAERCDQFLAEHPFSVIHLQPALRSKSKYVSDPHDEHVVQAAVQAKAEFLLTFNIKDFHGELIQRDFGIRILSQGYFLQWLRDLRA